MDFDEDTYLFEYHPLACPIHAWLSLNKVRTYFYIPQIDFDLDILQDAHLMADGLYFPVGTVLLC